MLNENENGSGKWEGGIFETSLFLVLLILQKTLVPFFLFNFFFLSFPLWTAHHYLPTYLT